MKNSVARSVVILAAALLTGIACAKEPAKQSRPNVILILSDDMGYSDLPKFGISEVPTPNIDRLADKKRCQVPFRFTAL